MNTRITREALRSAARQEQFLDITSRDEAERRFRSHLKLAPLGEETVALSVALGRVIARDVAAPVDVPGFDRASVDGFAVRADDTAGATGSVPRLLRLNPEMLTPGVQPLYPVQPGTATVIATGGMVPRGADAVVMVEQTDVSEAGVGMGSWLKSTVLPRRVSSSPLPGRTSHGARPYCVAAAC